MTFFLLYNMMPKSKCTLLGQISQWGEMQECEIQDQAAKLRRPCTPSSIFSYFWLVRSLLSLELGWDVLGGCRGQQTPYTNRDHKLISCPTLTGTTKLTGQPGMFSILHSLCMPQQSWERVWAAKDTDKLITIWYIAVKVKFRPTSALHKKISAPLSSSEWDRTHGNSAKISGFNFWPFIRQGGALANQICGSQNHISSVYTALVVTKDKIIDSVIIFRVTKSRVLYTTPVFRLHRSQGQTLSPHNTEVIF